MLIGHIQQDLRIHYVYTVVKKTTKKEKLTTATELLDGPTTHNDLRSAKIGASETVEVGSTCCCLRFVSASSAYIPIQTIDSHLFFSLNSVPHHGNGLIGIEVFPALLVGQAR
jgi:hypothetical protein